MKDECKSCKSTKEILKHIKSERSRLAWDMLKVISGKEKFNNLSKYNIENVFEFVDEFIKQRDES